MAVLLCPRYTSAALAELSAQFGLRHPDRSANLVRRAKRQEEESAFYRRPIAWVESQLAAKHRKPSLTPAKSAGMMDPAKMRASNSARCSLVSDFKPQALLRPNVQNHGVAASDVDFRFSPVGNSGGCSSGRFVGGWYAGERPSPDRSAGHLNARQKRRRSPFCRGLRRGTFSAGRAVAPTAWFCQWSCTCFLPLRKCDSGKVRSKANGFGCSKTFQRSSYFSSGAGDRTHRRQRLWTRTTRTTRRRKTQIRVIREFRVQLQWGSVGRTTELISGGSIDRPYRLIPSAV